MAITLTVTIQDNNDAIRVATAFAAKFGVPATAAGVKSVFASQIKQVVKTYEAEQVAKNLVITDVVTT